MEARVLGSRICTRPTIQAEALVEELHEIAFTAGHVIASAPYPHFTRRAIADATDAVDNIRKVDRAHTYGGISTNFSHELADEREPVFRETAEYLTARRTDRDIRGLAVTLAEDELLAVPGGGLTRLG